jgi:hypothetical protein
MWSLTNMNPFNDSSIMILFCWWRPRWPIKKTPSYFVFSLQVPTLFLFFFTFWTSLILSHLLCSWVWILSFVFHFYCLFYWNVSSALLIQLIHLIWSCNCDKCEGVLFNLTSPTNYNTFLKSTVATFCQSLNVNTSSLLLDKLYPLLENFVPFILLKS